MTRRKAPLLRRLGWRIRQLREERNWTQESLAEKVGLDRSYIAGIEAGLRNPSVKALAKIARGIGITLSHLFEGVH